MPITPFHFGPAALVHAIAPRQVSFLAYCTANVLVDLEPLFYMYTGQYPLHRFFHTNLGVGLVVLLTLTLFWLALRVRHVRWLPNLFYWKSLSALPIVLGSLMGGYSHVFLDSFMHADIRPFAPFSSENGLYRILSAYDLEWFCMAAGVVGVFVLLLRWVLARFD